MVDSRRKSLPVQPLTVFLMKTGIADYEDTLEDAGPLTKHAIKSSMGFPGALYLAPQRRAVPKWLEFLQDGAKGSIEERFNASTSAVLFVRAARRIFAFVFGYGRSLLDPRRIERSFGLRVVINAVDQNGLTSVDTKTVQELTVHTRRQTSRRSGLSDFGVDKEEDILGAVAGVPRDEKLGKRISGLDALRMSVPIVFRNLGGLCRNLLRIYRSADYRKQGFEFVDHVRSVSDPTLKEALDCRLLKALVEKNLDSIHLAPPGIVDWEMVEGFSFVRKADADPDLRLSSFFEQILRPDDLKIDRIKRQRVFVHLSGTTEPIAQWTFYRTLVAEFECRSRRYVLSGGEWYEIDPMFADAIRRKVQSMRPARLGLPPARPGEAEGAYNKRTSKRRGMYYLDRKFARVDGDPIEFCDLYSSKRIFVHVKRWRASSTLSHLFAQGRVSAEAFLFDAAFRREAREHLKRLAPSLAVHVPKGRPDPSGYTVAFAIIKEGGRGWKRSLPFFSQLQLARTTEALRRLGFEVRLEQIGVKKTR